MKNLLLFALGVTPVLAMGSQHPASGKPNIVIYLADDQSHADCSVYGAKTVRTPTADLLARAGITFDNAFVASPACAPSRAALLTGLMPARNGAEANHTYPRSDIPLLTARLQESGYQVLGFGKVAHDKMNAQCGFDYYSEPRINLFDHANTYFRENPVHSPVCLMMGDRRPHVPWTEKILYDPDKLTLPSWFIDTKETRKLRAAYYSDITGFDEEMGKVYRLAEEKFGNNFIFIYTADNGGQWPFEKWNLYEEGIHVPLIMVWPGHVKANTRTSAMVSWTDILPTLLDLTGGSVPAGLDGKSFKKVLLGQSNRHRKQIFTTHSGDEKMNVYPIRSVRDTRYKYILNLRPDCYHSNHSDILRKPNAGSYWDSWEKAAEKDPRAAAIISKYFVRPAEELYDLQNDPDEQVNLAADKGQKSRLASMRKKLEHWMQEQNDQKSTFQTPYPISGPKPHDLKIQ